MRWPSRRSTLILLFSVEFKAYTFPDMVKLSVFSAEFSFTGCGWGRKMMSDGNARN